MKMRIESVYLKFSFRLFFDIDVYYEEEDESVDLLLFDLEEDE
jgi:hypothetical protein